jgi:hypothetical protein
MHGNLAQELMDEFAESTGLSGQLPPRRYLWTDAFAVCNFLGLARQTGDERYFGFARKLVDQVHHTLGRHRDDDPRSGWISGLPDNEGEKHPTCGGLRIGKKLNERGSHQPADARLEWDQDGQYFHYLTKWMHALCRLAEETGEIHYHRWACELAVTAHHAFAQETLHGGRNRLVWKMSIDLSRPLVSSMGQHDPLDGLITCLELQTVPVIDVDNEADLTPAIVDLTEMCVQSRWATEDPLGIGGLLDDATRLAQLVLERKVDRRELLYQLMIEADVSLEHFAHSFPLGRSAEHRLAFRELGLSIGIHGLRWARDLVAHDQKLANTYDRLLQYQPIAQQIEAFWSDPAYRLSHTWIDHRDINTVMLATSLAPDSYLQV